MMQRNQVFSSGEVSDIERMIKRYIRRMADFGYLHTSNTAEMHLDGGWSDHDVIDAGDSAILSTDTNINGGSA